MEDFDLEGPLTNTGQPNVIKVIIKDFIGFQFSLHFYRILTCCYSHLALVYTACLQLHFVFSIGLVWLPIAAEFDWGLGQAFDIEFHSMIA